MTDRRRGICGLCYHSAGCGGDSDLAARPCPAVPVDPRHRIDEARHEELFPGDPHLRGALPAPIVEIHEEEAEPRGIRSGDQVMLKTSRGEVVMRAVVTDRIKSGGSVPSWSDDG